MPDPGHQIRSIAVPGEWSARAECARVGADMSLSNPFGPISAPSVLARTAVCAVCPVLVECRTWALTSPDPAFGHIAGGLHPLERSRMRRQGRTS